MKKAILFALVFAVVFTATSCSAPTDSVSSGIVSTDTSENATTSTVNTSSEEETVVKRAKILMMGDSTTNGDGNEAAFRFTMYQELIEAGCFFETVGDRTSDDYRLSGAYRKHLAKGGRRTDELTKTYTTRVLGGKMDYDIAVVTIGINDLFQGDNVSTLRTRYVELLDTMFNDRPDAQVFFAELIRMPGIPKVLFDTVDNIIAELVDEYKNKGYDITLLEHDLVSNYDYTNPDHCITFGPNSNHPNHIGNAEIGKGYAAALKDAILAINAQPADEDQTKAVAADSINLSETEVSLRINEQIKVEYQVYPINSDVASAVLTSSDPSVATVTAFGVITAHKAGTAVITARVTGEEIETTCTVTVTDEKFSITAAGKNVLLEERFNDANAWETGKQYVDAGELRLPWSSGLAAATNDSYTISKDAGSISFKCLISEQMANISALLFMKFGDYELQLYNNEAKVNLLYDNQVIGTYENTPQCYPADDFVINFVDGKVTVYRNNETIIVADAPADVDGKIDINFPAYGTLAIDDLIIKSGK